MSYIWQRNIPTDPANVGDLGFDPLGFGADEYFNEVPDIMFHHFSKAFQPSLRGLEPQNVGV